jgi:hypothetical protein
MSLAQNQYLVDNSFGILRLQPQRIQPKQPIKTFSSFTILLNQEN